MWSSSSSITLVMISPSLLCGYQGIKDQLMSLSDNECTSKHHFQHSILLVFKFSWNNHKQEWSKENENHIDSIKVMDLLWVSDSKRGRSSKRSSKTTKNTISKSIINLNLRELSSNALSKFKFEINIKEINLTSCSYLADIFCQKSQ